MSMKPWTRDDTKDWIQSLESRTRDIRHFMERTIEWCEEQDIDDERIVFMCCFLTCIWVSQLRGEEISYVELMEFLGAEEVRVLEEKFYSLDSKFLELEHEELLQKAVNMLGDNGFDDYGLLS